MLVVLINTCHKEQARRHRPTLRGGGGIPARCRKGPEELHRRIGSPTKCEIAMQPQYLSPVAMNTQAHGELHVLHKLVYTYKISMFSHRVNALT